MEIEIKAKLVDKDGVVEKLRALGCEFSPVKTQDDMVWVEKVGSMEEFLANPVFMRIRVQNGEKVIMTAKKSKTDLKAGGAANLVKREHEVVVDSAEEARGILEMLGLKEAVRAVKKRQTASLSGYEICIDEVEGLGSFIELEKMGEKEDAPQIQKEMSDFLATLGVTEEDQVHKGYDILMLEKQGL
jgi:adenylate cyclase, class 2